MKLFKKKLSIEELLDRDVNRVLKHVSFNVEKIFPKSYKTKITAWKNVDEFSKKKPQKNFSRSFSIDINFPVNLLPCNFHKPIHKLCEFFSENDLTVYSYDTYRETCKVIIFFRKEDKEYTHLTTNETRLLKLKKLNKKSIYTLYEKFFRF